jgi:hypothetical protein
MCDDAVGANQSISMRCRKEKLIRNLSSVGRVVAGSHGLPNFGEHRVLFARFGDMGSDEHVERTRTFERDLLHFRRRSIGSVGLAQGRRAGRRF